MAFLTPFSNHVSSLSRISTSLSQLRRNQWTYFYESWLGLIGFKDRWALVEVKDVKDCLKLFYFLKMLRTLSAPVAVQIRRTAVHIYCMLCFMSSTTIPASTAKFPCVDESLLSLLPIPCLVELGEY